MRRIFSRSAPRMLAGSCGSTMSLCLGQDQVARAVVPGTVAQLRHSHTDNGSANTISTKVVPTQLTQAAGSLASLQSKLAAGLTSRDALSNAILENADMLELLPCSEWQYWGGMPIAITNNNSCRVICKENEHDILYCIFKHRNQHHAVFKVSADGKREILSWHDRYNAQHSVITQIGWVEGSEGYYCCTFKDINPKRGSTMHPEIAEFFKTAMEPPTSNVGVAFHNLYDSLKPVISGLPKYFRPFADDIKKALRPMPGALYDIRTHRTKNYGKKYTLVFNGTSGSGKTVSALMLPEGDFKGLHESRTIEEDERQQVVGLYIAQGKDVAASISGASDNKLQQLREDSARDVGINIGQRIKDHIDRTLKLDPKRTPVPPLSLKGVLFYIVLDEMGAAKATARDIATRRTTMVGAIRQYLGTKGFDHIHSCDFVISLVGTGVTAPETDGGSLPQDYSLYTPADPSSSLFVYEMLGKLMKDWELSPAFKALSPEEQNEQRDSELFKNNTYCQEVYNVIKKHPNLKAIIANLRCAVLMAQKVKALSNFGLIQLIEDDKERISAIEKLISIHSNSLEVSTVAEYITRNGWQQFSFEQQRFYAAMLVSLVFTQPKGFHLLPLKVADVLVTKLGAISDCIDLAEAAASHVSGSALPTFKHSNASDAKPIGYAPMDTQRTGSFNVTLVEPGPTRNMRFVVPAASVLVALNILADTIGSGGKVTPLSYEALISQSLLAVMHAFTVFNAEQSTPEFQLPVMYLLPNVTGSVAKEVLNLRVPADYPLGPVTNLAKVHNYKPWQEISAEGLQTQSHTSRAKLAEGVTERFDTHGAAVVVAGEDIPLNDITIFTKTQTIGIELKKYEAGRLLSIDTLRKRCHQMGFGWLRVTAPLEREGIKSCLPLNFHQMFQYSELMSLPLLCVARVLSADHAKNKFDLLIDRKAGKLSNLGMWFHTVMRTSQRKVRGAPNVDTKEFLVCCSPESPLLPPGFSARFIYPNEATELDLGADESKTMQAKYKIRKPFKEVNVYDSNGNFEGLFTAESGDNSFEPYRNAVNEPSGECEISTLVLSAIGMAPQCERDPPSTPAVIQPSSTANFDRVEIEGNVLVVYKANKRRYVYSEKRMTLYPDYFTI